MDLNRRDILKTLGAFVGWSFMGGQMESASARPIELEDDSGDWESSESSSSESSESSSSSSYSWSH